jgi:hypothetical protein
MKDIDTSSGISPPFLSGSRNEASDMKDIDTSMIRSPMMKTWLPVEMKRPI